MQKYNPDLVYQVVRAKMLNKKRPIASTKDRSEVRGGGRKPWPQKGTGRARAGSIRSPLWRGGGITFGPQSQRNYATGIPKKMARLAFAHVLERKREDKELILAEAMPLDQPKTKHFHEWLGTVGAKGSALVVFNKNPELLKRAGRNIPGIKVLDPANVDILDLLQYKYLVTTKEALRKLEERTKF